MDCTGCIHKKICELWGNAEGQDASCYDDSCKETIKDILGYDYDLDRMRELVEADQDGRCVVLPCKVGTIVYSVRHERVPDDDYRMSSHIERSVVAQKFRLIHADCIGKTVFLTREAAESALKGDQHE